MQAGQLSCGRHAAFRSPAVGTDNSVLQWPFTSARWRGHLCPIAQHGAPSCCIQPDAMQSSQMVVSRRTLLLSAAVAAATLQGKLPSKAQAGTLMSAPGQSAASYDTEPALKSAVRRTGRVAHSEEEWQTLLSVESYATLRLAVTEPPYSSPLLNENSKGTFECVGCSSSAFSSDAKFDAGTGWPSFFQALPGTVTETNDFSDGMQRTEVRCSACQGHFGHVFRDARLITGNQQLPTNLRYCMNGNALHFEAA